MSRFAEFIDILKGAFRLRIQPNTLTANRTLVIPNRSGTVVTMPSDLVNVDNARKPLRINAAGNDTEFIGRVVLTADTTFFASPTGVNTNNGLTAGTPKTLTGVLSYVSREVDCGGFNVIIKLAQGTYNVSQLVLPNLVGCPSAQLQGTTTTTVIDCRINTTSVFGVSCESDTFWTISFCAFANNNTGQHTLLINNVGSAITLEQIAFIGGNANCIAISGNSNRTIFVKYQIYFIGTFKDIIGGHSDANKSFTLILTNTTILALNSIGTIPDVVAATNFINMIGAIIIANNITQTGTFNCQKFNLNNCTLVDAPGAGIPGNTPGVFINEKQPIDSDLTAIAALTTNGLIEKTGTGTATTRPIGATGAASLAAADAVAGRAAIGLGSIATQNEDALTLKSPVAGSPTRLNLFGGAIGGNDQNAGVSLRLGINFAANRQIFLGASDDPANGRQLRVSFYTGYNPIFDGITADGVTATGLTFGNTVGGCGFGGADAPADAHNFFAGPSTKPNIAKFNQYGGAERIAILHSGGIRFDAADVLKAVRTASKTITAPSANDTFIWSIAQPGDWIVAAPSNGSTPFFVGCATATNLVFNSSNLPINTVIQFTILRVTTS